MPEAGPVAGEASGEAGTGRAQEGLGQGLHEAHDQRLEEHEGGLGEDGGEEFGHLSTLRVKRGYNAIFGQEGCHKGTAMMSIW